MDQDKSEFSLTGLLRRLRQEAEGTQTEFKKISGNLLQVAFQRLDLVTREEFDVQSQVLQRTREKLEMAERELQHLEERVAQALAQHSDSNGK